MSVVLARFSECPMASGLCWLLMKWVLLSIREYVTKVNDILKDLSPRNIYFLTQSTSALKCVCSFWVRPKYIYNEKKKRDTESEQEKEIQEQILDSLARKESRTYLSIKGDVDYSVHLIILNLLS